MWILPCEVFLSPTLLTFSSSTTLYDHFYSWFHVLSLPLPLVKYLYRSKYIMCDWLPEQAVLQRWAQQCLRMLLFPLALPPSPSLRERVIIKAAVTTPECSYLLKLSLLIYILCCCCDYFCCCHSYCCCCCYPHYILLLLLQLYLLFTQLLLIMPCTGDGCDIFIRNLTVNLVPLLYKTKQNTS